MKTPILNKDIIANFFATPTENTLCLPDKPLRIAVGIPSTMKRIYNNFIAHVEIIPMKELKRGGYGKVALSRLIKRIYTSNYEFYFHHKKISKLAYAHIREEFFRYFDSFVNMSDEQRTQHIATCNRIRDSLFFRLLQIEFKLHYFKNCGDKLALSLIAEEQMSEVYKEEFNYGMHKLLLDFQAISKTNPQRDYIMGEHTLEENKEYIRSLVRSFIPKSWKSDHLRKDLEQAMTKKLCEFLF